MMNTLNLKVRQQGVVLLVALLFLIVLTLLGTAASRGVTSQERMSRYLREYNTAFQAAESALADAKEDIRGAFVKPKGAAANPNSKVRIDLQAIFTPSCAYGLCAWDKTGNGPWKDAANWSKATSYGTYTGRSPLPKSAVLGQDADANSKNADEVTVSKEVSASTNTSKVTGVWKQPIYLIEGTRDLRSGTKADFGTPSAPYLYRITGRGFGADPNTVATVQEIHSDTVNSLGF
jgi:type IV pilus assembly protein PilX